MTRIHLALTIAYIGDCPLCSNPEEAKKHFKDKILELIDKDICLGDWIIEQIILNSTDQPHFIFAE